MLLPLAFCWTKFGTEAGEIPEAILDRKESERRGNQGIFLWGIGSSIRPSMLQLLETTEAPEVLFSPLLSPPASRDTNPPSLVMWQTATAMDGSPYELPSHSLVTSRLSKGSARHYALVCCRDTPLLEKLGEPTWIDTSQVRNIRNGTVVGPSQVTSVVRQVPSAGGGRRYRVAFRAHLVYPYLAVLGDPLILRPSQRLDRIAGSRRDALFEELRGIRTTVVINGNDGARSRRRAIRNWHTVKL